MTKPCSKIAWKTNLFHVCILISTIKYIFIYFIFDFCAFKR